MASTLDTSKTSNDNTLLSDLIGQSNTGSNPGFSPIFEVDLNVPITHPKRLDRCANGLWDHTHLPLLMYVYIQCVSFSRANFLSWIFLKANSQFLYIIEFYRFFKKENIPHPFTPVLAKKNWSEIRPAPIRVKKIPSPGMVIFTKYTGF